MTSGREGKSDKGELSPKLQSNSRERVTVGLVGLFLFLFSLFSLSLASLSDILESVAAAQLFGQMSVLTSAS